METLSQKRHRVAALPLTEENHLTSLVENKTTFTLNHCEFSLFETHQVVKDVGLKFGDLTFTSMLRGKKHMKLKDKTEYFDYLPGESVLVAPNETMLINFPEADIEVSQCIALSLSPEYVESSLNYFNQKFQKVDDQSWRISSEDFYLFNNSHLANATNNIVRIAMEDNTNKDLMADFALKELLVRLMQTQAGAMVEKSFAHQKNSSRLAFIVDYIKNNLDQKISIDHLSKLAYVSNSNFFKLFKYELGVSPNEFILNERIKKAKELLKNQQSVKEVAYSTGFLDSNHFIKTFKSYEGVTPKNYQLEILSESHN